MPKKLTTAEFVVKAQTVHGLGTYNYDQIEYHGSQIKIAINCGVHGVFQQTPNAHLAGHGCAKCALDTKVHSTAGFIAKAQAVHGVGTYDYSQVVYVESNAKVKIICPKHGVFEQAPNKHLCGRGCPACGKKTQADSAMSQSLTTAQFIQKARATHGVGTYNYSQVVCTGAERKVRIICPHHGAFEQIAAKHYAGRGCFRCVSVRQSHDNLLTTADFITRATVAHGSRYDYSRSVYAGYKKPVTILCAQHGAFTQKPQVHIAGSGCQICGAEYARLGWISQAKGRVTTLYLLRFFREGEQFYKVGITYHSIKHRYRETQNYRGYQYEILAQHHSADAARIYDWEQSIIQTFAHLRYRPKKRFAGATECFSSCEEILKIFPL